MAQKQCYNIFFNEIFYGGKEDEDRRMVKLQNCIFWTHVKNISTSTLLVHGHSS